MTPLTPDQLTMHTVADFLNTSDGPFHITPNAARALAPIFQWFANLDSDQTGDNQIILAAAKAFDVEQSQCNNDVHLICVLCRIEQHNGQRETPAPAAAIVNGMSVCLDHWQIVDGPVLPDRSAGGIILPGQINGS